MDAGGSRREHIGCMLGEGEARGACVAPSSHADGMAMGRMVGSGELVRLARGHFARRGYWEALDVPSRHLHLARSLSRAHPDWTFCGPTAAVARGLPVSFGQLARIHVAHGPGGRHGTRLVAFHQLAREGGLERAHASGIPVTTFERSVVDCLLMMGFSDGLVVADAALARTGRDARWLEGLVRDLGRRRPGVRRALATAARADRRAESGGESIARATMIELGFAAPELQAEFVDPLSGRVSRVDFLWRLPDRTLVAGELDGRQKYVDPTMTRGRATVDLLADERLRESRLTRVARVVRFSFADVFDRGRFARLLDSFGVPRA